MFPLRISSPRFQPQSKQCHHTYAFFGKRGPKLSMENKEHIRVMLKPRGHYHVGHDSVRDYIVCVSQRHQYSIELTMVALDVHHEGCPVTSKHLAACTCVSTASAMPPCGYYKFETLTLSSSYRLPKNSVAAVEM